MVVTSTRDVARAGTHACCRSTPTTAQHFFCDSIRIVDLHSNDDSAKLATSDGRTRLAPTAIVLPTQPASCKTSQIV
jgi:hypothetical protein